MHGYDDIILFISYDLQVTMEWWTHLWLNEGFATWIEYLCVDHTHPDYDIWTNFLSLEYAVAMNLDSLANSHPIEVSD
jgi:aminopeptidase 2